MYFYILKKRRPPFILFFIFQLRFYLNCCTADIKCYSDVVNLYLRNGKKLKLLHLMVASFPLQSPFTVVLDLNLHSDNSFHRLLDLFSLFEYIYIDGCISHCLNRQLEFSVSFFLLSFPVTWMCVCSHICVSSFIFLLYWLCDAVSINWLLLLIPHT